MLQLEAERDRLEADRLLLTHSMERTNVGFATADEHMRLAVLQRSYGGAFSREGHAMAAREKMSQVRGHMGYGIWRVLSPHGAAPALVPLAV